MHQCIGRGIALLLLLLLLLLKAVMRRRRCHRQEIQV